MSCMKGLGAKIEGGIFLLNMFQGSRGISQQLTRKCFVHITGQCSIIRAKHVDKTRDVLCGVRDDDGLRNLHNDPSVIFLKSGIVNWSDRCGEGDFSNIYTLQCMLYLDIGFFS